MSKNLLDDREERYRSILNLGKKFHKTVVCGKLNYPGKVKNTQESDMAFKELRKLLLELYSDDASYSQDCQGLDGSSILFLVDMEAEAAKERAVRLENSHVLGRIFDIDIYLDNGHPLSRADIDMEPRKCIICGDDARTCIREGSHSLDQVIDKTNCRINDYFNDKFCQHVREKAIRAVLYEVSASPKPGLVDRFNSGAHTDMDFFTFMTSTASIQDLFYKSAQAGIRCCNDDNILESARHLGIESEEKMFQSTGGVNTHKGMIFSIGLVSLAAGLVFARKKSFTMDAEDLCSEIASITRGISARELLGNSMETYGQRIYDRYRLKGIRGEAESGYSTVRQHGLPVLRELSGRKDMKTNDILVQVLLHIMKHSEDTNILGRHDFDTLDYVKERSANALRLGGIHTERGREEIRLMDRDFIQRNISPGGSADMLAVAIMLHLLECNENCSL